MTTEFEDQCRDCGQHLNEGLHGLNPAHIARKKKKMPRPAESFSAKQRLKFKARKIAASKGSSM